VLEPVGCVISSENGAYSSRASGKYTGRPAKREERREKREERRKKKEYMNNISRT
jgi:hypothetical protein